VRSQQSASTHRMSCSSTEAPSLETGAGDRATRAGRVAGPGRRRPQGSQRGILVGDSQSALHLDNFIAALSDVGPPTKGHGGVGPDHGPASTDHARSRDANIYFDKIAK
jgi:hypothetical protein